jgi:hypothetical protein
MTQEYLAGELSQLLGELQALAANRKSARDLACLRREAETWPLPALRSVTARALALTDGLCWESLEGADATTFTRQAALSVEMHVLGVCGGLLDDE